MAATSYHDDRAGNAIEEAERSSYLLHDTRPEVAVLEKVDFVDRRGGQNVMGQILIDIRSYIISQSGLAETMSKQRR